MTVSAPPDQRWYWGKCVSNRAMTALFDVTHSQKAAGRFEHIDNPRTLFPKKGQAELFGVEAKNIAIGEYYRFQVKAQNRPGSQAPTRIISQRKALPFHDATATRDTTSPISMKAFAKGSDCIIRISDGTVVRMTVTTASQVPGIDEIDRLEDVAVHKFDPTSLLAVAGESGVAHFYDADLGDTVRTADWMTDATYVKAGLRAAVREASNDTSHLEGLIQWLDEKTTTLKGGVSALGGDDLSIHEEIARTERLAAALRREKSIIGDYLEAMKSDPAIAALLERAVQGIADSQREGIIQAARDEATAAVQQEAEAKRSDLFSLVSREAAELESDMLARIEKMEAERLSSLEAQCADREKASTEAIEAMSSDLRQIGQEIDELKRSKLDLEVEIEDLQVRRSGAIIDLQRLNEVSSRSAKAEGQKSLRPIVPHLPLPTASVAQFLRHDEWRQHIAQAPCLSSAGKALMERFTALLLAGEVPIIHGSCSEDFLAIAATLIAGGRRVALDVDPTIITTDDIWIRPSGKISTAFGRALSTLEDDREAAPVLGVIRQAERSGMRFWLPGLSTIAAEGLAQRRFLPCVHVADVKSDEAEAAVQGYAILDVGEEILGGQESLAVATGVFDAARRILVLDDATEGDATVLGVIGALGIRSPAIVARLRKIAPVALQVMTAEAADTLLRDLAKLFMNARAGAVR